MQLDTSALLIGSWEFHKYGRCPDNKRVGQKLGIGGIYVESEWVTGDLDYMRRLLRRKDIHIFAEVNYEERDADGGYASGRYDILRKIDEFFQQDKTHFVLYFTGHGAEEDGSWCFAVKKLARRGSRSSTRVEEGGKSTRGCNLSTDDSNDSQVTCEASNGQIVSSDLGVEAAVSGSFTSLLSDLDDSYSQPAPIENWNDFVEYEEVLHLWDENKKGRERFLMIIVDCSFSGWWVNKVNGANNDQNDTSDATDQPRNEKRNDVCIQASCRATEKCYLAGNLLSSMFTRAFYEAQVRAPLNEAQVRPPLKKMVLSAIKHLLPTRRPFTPVSSEHAPFGGFLFFDSFEDMH